MLILLDTQDAYYWATHAGAELDLLVLRGGRRYGFEFNYADAPRTTRFMHIAISDLRLDHLWVIHPGTKSWPADERITMCPPGEAAALAKEIS